MFWSHANGGVRGFYWISTSSLRFFGEGYCIVAVQCMYGSVRCMCEHRTNRMCLRTPVDHCMWPVRVPVMAMSAHAGSWPDMTAYVPSTGKKRCACTTFKHGLLLGIQGLYGFKNCRTPLGPVRYATRSPTCHWNFGPYGAPVNLSCQSSHTRNTALKRISCK